MADIVYQHRYGSLISYDSAFIEHLQEMGFGVDAIPAADVESYDYSGAELFIVGPPGSNYTENPAGPFVHTLKMPVISTCRHTSRNDFHIGTASGSNNQTTFRVADQNHDITEGLPFSVTIGPSYSSQILNELTEGTHLIMDRGSAASAGLAERFVAIEGEDYARIHWSYQNAQHLNADGWDIFEKTLVYLKILPYSYEPTGYRISCPLALSELEKPLRIRWSATTPAGTSLKVETAPTQKDYDLAPLEDDLGQGLLTDVVASQE